MKRRFLYIASLIVALTATSFAQPARKVRLETKINQDRAVFKMGVKPSQKFLPGNTFTTTIHVDLKKPWYVYSATNSDEAPIAPLELTVPPELSPYYELIEFSEKGAMHTKYDSNFAMELQYLNSDFDVVAKVKVKEGLTQDSIPFYLHLKYSTCSTSICLPPRTFAVPMTVIGDKPFTIRPVKGTIDVAVKDTVVKINADSLKLALSLDTPVINNTQVKPPDSVTKAAETGGDAPADPPKQAGVGNADDVIAIAKSSTWEFMLAAAGFGLLALLTPCVFPMVPITVSFFTKRNAGSRKAAVKDASLYAGGIIVTFVMLGFLLALVAGASGINKFAANPWINLVIAGIFVTFALNLFGLFEIGVPSSLLNSLNSAAQKSKNKSASVLLMGFVFSLTSFTCTVPFVGTLMVTFSKGEWFVPILGMIVFATIFALPFFILALFPSMMKALPRSGGWMNSVKVVMGFLEIGAALKFISNADLIWNWQVLNRDLAIAAWVALMAITSLYLLGKFRMSHDTPVDHIGAMRALMAVMFLSLGLYLCTGFHGKPLGEIDALLPPNLEPVTTSVIKRPTEGQPASHEEGKWHSRYSEALAEAQRTGKNIFVDFTGYTCTNCRAMEGGIFAQPDIKETFKDFVLARLYTDDGSPLNDSNRVMEEERFNTIALPFYAVISPDDKPLNTFPGFTRDKAAFKSFLDAHRKKPIMPSVAMIN